MRLTKAASVGLASAIFVAAACSSGDNNGSNNNAAAGSGGFGNPYGGASGVGGVVVPPTCNNGVRDTGEVCDGADLGGATCASATLNARTTGTLSCTPQCQLDTNGCTGGQMGTAGTGGGTGVGTGGLAGTAGTGAGNGGTQSSGGVPGSAGAQGSGGGTAGSGETGRMVGMTDAMNQVRHGVSTQNPLPDLTWSPAIAQVAQAYADQLKNTNGCNMVHSGNPSYGENLAWFGGSSGGTAQESVSLWASEGDCYNYGPITRNDSCPCAIGGACGHYTQIVWRGTTQVGCGVATCASSEIWVCNFAPPGNYIGQNPY